MPFTAPGRLFQVRRPETPKAGNRAGLFRVSCWNEGDVFTEAKFREIYPCPDDSEPEAYYAAMLERLLTSARLEPTIGTGEYKRGGVIREVAASEGLKPTEIPLGAPETMAQPKYVDPHIALQQAVVKTMSEVFAAKLAENQQATRDDIARMVPAAVAAASKEHQQGKRA